jgi:hypothetical protein
LRRRDTWVMLFGMRLPPSRVLLSAFAVFAALLATAGATTLPGLTSVSTDPYANSASQHATEVEPDTYAFGSTLVATFQAGRFDNGGASNIGWAVLTGGSWTHGVLPSLTAFSSPAGSYDRATDPSAAYDAKDGVWMINSLGLAGSNVGGVAVVVNRWDTKAHASPTFDAPVTVAAASGNQDFDKNWIACDNSAGSPYYGRCYVEWDDFGNGNRVHVAYSANGGLTWTEGTIANIGVIGGQPVVQPNGHVVMPIDNSSSTTLESFVSSDGGATWQGPYTITNIASHGEAGGLRSGPLPTAEADGAGKVYVAWADCRFVRRCTANDIVYATSSDGQNWSSVTRVPIDSVTSGVDHFLPGLGVDPATSGGSAHLGLAYYYYPSTKCGGRKASGCQLDVGFVSSTNGGSSWSSPTALTQSPMSLTWLPKTTEGRMVGDYISTSFLGGTAYPVVAAASAPTSGGNDCATATPNCDEEMYAPTGGLSAAGGTVVASDLPVPNAASDHAAPQSAIFR